MALNKEAFEWYKFKKSLKVKRIICRRLGIARLSEQVVVRWRFAILLFFWRTASYFPSSFYWGKAINSLVLILSFEYNILNDSDIFIYA